MNKISKKIPFFFVAFMLFSSLGMGYINKNDENGDRIYVDSESIKITKSGIFLDIEGAIYSVGMICSDEMGLYIPSFYLSKALGDCPNGHSRGCSQCYGCCKKDCRYSCKCWKAMK